MNLNITLCPTCGSDQIKKVCRDWTGTYQGQAYVVPELAFYECPVCGERIFDREALGRIQASSPAFVKRSRQTLKNHAVPTGGNHPSAAPA